MKDCAIHHFLNNIYRNAEMGRDALYFVLRRSGNAALRQLMLTQLGEYQAIMDEAEVLLKAEGARPQGIKASQRFMIRMAACRELAKDDSTAAMADMLIQGSCIGVTKISRQLTRFRERCPEGAGLAKKLQETEENNIQQLKKYL